MPDIRNILNHLAAEWAMIKGAPIMSIGSLLFSVAVIWLILDWTYGQIIAKKEADISYLRDQLTYYKTNFIGHP